MKKKKKKQKEDFKTGKKKKTTAVSSISEGPRGLVNIGNSCFLGAALQALVAVLSQDDIFSFSREVEEIDQPSRVSSVFLQTILTLKQAVSSPSSLKCGPYNPGMLLSAIGRIAPHFKGRGQQDSHELLITLLSALSEEGKSGKTNETFQFLRLFEGHLGSIIECLKCRERSCSLQSCYDVSLQIPGSQHLMSIPRAPNTKSTQKKERTKSDNDAATKEFSFAVLDQNSTSKSSEDLSEPDDDPEVSSGLITALHSNCLSTSDNTIPNSESEKFTINIVEPPEMTNERSGVLRLDNCLSAFTMSEELLSQDGNGYLCSRCNKKNNSADTSLHSMKSDARKRLVIVDPPSILIIHLKRLLPRGKYSKFVAFPFHMSINDFVGKIASISDSNFDDDDDCNYAYELRAVVVHQGGASGGHYISYVRLGSDKWYHASDSFVRPATEAEVMKSEAYMLFYNRVTDENDDYECGKSVSSVESHTTSDFEVLENATKTEENIKSKEDNFETRERIELR